MTTHNTTTPLASERITVIDALRGFALLGVILMHMLDHFGYSGQYTEGGITPSVWDSAIQWLTNMMIRGKFISIFSFLFGLSFYIQMERAAKKGIDFRARFLWRMLLLFMIGLVGTCFTYVDILPVYAIFGVVLVFLFPLKNWVLMTIACLLLLGIPNLLLTGVAPAAPPSSPVVLGELVDPVIAEGTSFWSSAKENLTVKMLEKLQFQFIYSGTGYLILALFIMGFVVGRLRFFEQVHIRKKLNVRLFLLFIFGSFLFLLLNKWLPQAPIDLTGTLNTLVTLSLAGVLAMGFILIYQVPGIRKYLSVLSAYGRMGLTNYELQNITGAILFSGWGLGALFGTMGAATLFLLGWLIYSVQVLVSVYWVRRFLYGPLEWLWRSGTYLKWQPFKRNYLK